MEKKSSETQKTAQTVTEQKPEENKPIEKTAIRQLYEKELTPDKMQILKGMGADKLIGGLMEWADAMEKALREDRQVLQQIVPHIKPIADFATKIQQAQAGQGVGSPQAGGGGTFQQLAQLAQMAQQMGFVGGGNSLGDELTKKVMQAGLDQMFAGTRLLNAIQVQLMSKMGVKAVEEAAQAVVTP